MLEETLACLVRKGHPAIRRRLTLAQYAAASHIVVALKGNILPELVLRRLAETGMSLNVGLQVPHILAAPIIVAKSNHIATLPGRVARTYTEFLDVKLFKVPFAFPSYAVSLIWHERAHRDPASIWLRELLQDVCRTI